MLNEKPRSSDAPLTMDSETVPPPAEPTVVDLEVPAVPNEDDAVPTPRVTPPPDA